MTLKEEYKDEIRGLFESKVFNLYLASQLYLDLSDSISDTYL